VQALDQCENSAIGRLQTWTKRFSASAEVGTNGVNFGTDKGAADARPQESNAGVRIRASLRVSDLPRGLGRLLGWTSALAACLYALMVVSDLVRTGWSGALSHGEQRAVLLADSWLLILAIVSSKAAWFLRARAGSSAAAAERLSPDASA
jgi:hypothetical protein